jgi:hypothetical protein
MIDETSSKYMEIYDIAKNICDKTKYYTYNQTRNTFIKKWTDTVYLIMTTEMSFVDIYIYTSIIRGYRDIEKLDIMKRDFVNTDCKFVCLHFFNLSLDDIKMRYDDIYENIEERMFFRLTLYKEGWSIASIEKYINTYLSKADFDKKKINAEYYKYHYKNLFSKVLNLKIKNVISKVGRPLLPEELKNIIKLKHNEKVKTIMNHKYVNNIKYEKIKTHLLTPEEFSIIKDKITGYEDIINKLSHFIFE